MDFATFTTHLTDVTDPVVTHYIQQVWHDFKLPNSNRYPNQICERLMKQLMYINQQAKTPLEQYGVKDNNELIDICLYAFDGLYIYKIDSPMSKQIATYFDKLGLLFERQFDDAISVDDMVTHKFNIYFDTPFKIDDPAFQRSLNSSVFGGAFDNVNSLDRFLKTI